MSQKERINRPAQTIKATVTPISNTVKEKIASAFQTVVTEIKNKHLG
jgi:hypothetical protein